MATRQWTWRWCVVCLLLAAVSSTHAAPPVNQPNLLFIMTDDHASHAMSCYGSRINKTPNLDRLAIEGMRFANCFVTNSICGPSRAAILTGKYSHQNGYFRNEKSFDGAQQTFPKLLQKAGYETAIIGKWHLGSDPTGFDHWDVLLGQGPYFNPPLKSRKGISRYTGYTTDVITDLALDYMEKGRDKSKPFLLMYQHKAPHREWHPALRHRTLFENETIPEPPTLFDDYSNRSRAARMQEMTVGNHLTPIDLKLVPPRNLTPEQLAEWHAHYDPKNVAWNAAKPSSEEAVRRNYQRYIKDYLRCVHAVDEGVGRVLDYLDRTGLAANTVVIYTSDQGFFLGDHGWYDKRWMYEESLRSPLLVRWPGVAKPGSVNNDLTLNLDFAQTLLDLAGAPIPNDMQGRSLVPLLKGQKPTDWRTSIYYRYYEYPGPHSVRQHYGVRTRRHKLIHYPDFNEWELFDLEGDPHELRNIVGDPVNGKLVVKLKTELKRLQEHYKDEGQGVTDNQPRVSPAKAKGKKAG